MQDSAEHIVSAFNGHKRVAHGHIAEVARKLKRELSELELGSVLIFNDSDSYPVEIDFRGSENEVVARLPQQAEGQDDLAKAVQKTADPIPAAPTAESGVDIKRGRGRPKLGVVSREVTLLPRHWQWLNSQPGGASVALRKLVEQASRGSENRDRQRYSRDITYRSMSAIAGDLPGFEEASRALFAGKQTDFYQRIEQWPPDICAHLKKMSAAAFNTALKETGKTS